MKRLFVTTVAGVFMAAGLFSQKPTLQLTFTAIKNTTYIQSDSIKIVNRSAGCDTLLYWPDTVLVLDYLATEEHLHDENTFRLFPNYPNPFSGVTYLSFYLPQRDEVIITIAGTAGSATLRSERVLGAGLHTFRYAPGNSTIHFITITWQGYSRTIKALSVPPNSVQAPVLEYSGSRFIGNTIRNGTVNKRFVFDPGDDLLYTCYYQTLQSGIIDSPENSSSYTFQFATNIPCPGEKSITYRGKTYNTIQVFSQCWMKENLNTGVMIDGFSDMKDDDRIEKYCYDNEWSNCTTYGGLYQWDEMMQYSDEPGARGICPEGWHVPTDEEWKLLEGMTDSQYEIGDPVWDEELYRGFDAGGNLKTVDNWIYNAGSTDLYGFSALPGGYRYEDQNFDNFGSSGYQGYWWSSSGYGNGISWFRNLAGHHNGSGRGDSNKTHGYSVRCLRD